MAESTECLACGEAAGPVSVAQPVAFEYGVTPQQSFAYRKCEGCESEWLDPRPTTDELTRFYPSSYHAHNDDHGIVAALLVRTRSERRGRVYRRFYGALLIATLPLELLAVFTRRTGTVDVRARRAP